MVIDSFIGLIINFSLFTISVIDSVSVMVLAKSCNLNLTSVIDTSSETDFNLPLTTLLNSVIPKVSDTTLAIDIALPLND